jgi:3',5'-cyclic AMP phosphodiesterase CpdA
MNNTSNRRSFLRKATISGALVPLTVSVAHLKTRHEVRFAVVSDGHFGQPETDYVRFHQEMIAWLNDEHDGKGLDFVILNGDLIHDAPEHLAPLKVMLEELTAPHFAVKGNHDMVSAATWEGTWGYGENHSFERGEYAFLLGSTSNQEGEYLCVNLDWLRTCLQSYSDKRAVFLFLHINQNGLTRHSVSCPKVVSVLEGTPNLAAVFHGHDHDQDNVIYSNKRPYLFDGHLGGSWGTNYQGYRIVEIDLDGQVRSYQCNPAAFRVNSTRLGFGKR